MTVATKKNEFVLSNEARELYEKCWNIANESLQKLKIDAKFMHKIRDPYEFNRVFWSDVDIGVEMSRVSNRLEVIFAKKNDIPEKIEDDKKLVDFLSNYIEKNFGRRLDVIILRGGAISTDWDRTIMFPVGFSTLDAIHGIPHEISHMTESFAKRLREVDALVAPIYKNSTQQIKDFVKLTGASERDIVDEANIQKTVYPHTKFVVFLLHLYEVGLYKPKDEKIKQSLELAKFYGDKDMRRAYIRYSEGRADSATLVWLRGDEDTLRVYASSEIMLKLVCPPPRSNLEVNNMDIVFGARYAEGFRSYYTLQKRVGEEKLIKFEEECARTDRIPGIDINGDFVVIDAKKLKMQKINLERLIAGFGNVEELIGNESKLPKKMG
jgi:hypothetical protein